MNKSEVIDSYGEYTDKKFKRAKGNNSKSISVGSKDEMISLSMNRDRRLGEPVAVRALSIGREKAERESNMKLYDLNSQTDLEINKYVIWLKTYMKLYRAMFHKYATVSQNKQQIRKHTFDDMYNEKETMNLTEIFAFLNDFQICQYFNLKREDIKRLIKLINLKSDGSAKNRNSN